MDDVARKVESIFGWIDANERDYLYSLAKNCRQGVIVEIGSFKGKSSTCLGLGSLHGFQVPVFAIDPFEPYFDAILEVEFPNSLSEFQSNIRRVGLDGIVRPIKMTSKEAAISFRDPIGLLFIDGCHDFGVISSDLSTWTPKLVPGGILAVHDCAPGGNWLEPQKAFEVFLQKSSHFKFLTFVGSIGVARKQ